LKDFRGFFIGKETEFMEKHCGKYPVVLLNMKAFGGRNWEQMLDDLWAMLKSFMFNQAPNLDDEGIDFIGVKYRDSEAKPNESTTKRFLAKPHHFLTSKISEKSNCFD
jgi:hypothetical protein